LCGLTIKYDASDKQLRVNFAPASSGIRPSTLDADGDMKRSMWQSYYQVRPRFIWPAE